MVVEVGDAVVGEELRRRPLPGGLLGHSLGAVLAELGGMAFLGVRIRPGAAHAVEAVSLIELEQRPGGSPEAHLRNTPLECHPDSGQTGSGLLGLGDVDVLILIDRHRRARCGTD
ncbi:hypothetical protein [Aeromicrobium sp.]